MIGRILLPLTFLLHAGLAAQDRAGRVLTVTEIDDDGKAAVREQVRMLIVDINSSIRLDINRDSLRAFALSLAQSGGTLEEMIERIQLLQRLADSGLVFVDRARDALLLWAEDDPGSNQAVQDALDPLGYFLNEAENIAADDTLLLNAIIARLDAEVLSTPPNDGRIVFEMIAAEAERLRGAVDDILEDEGVQVQMGAWTTASGVEVPVHLDGFDEYPEGEFFEVDRWNIALSSEQLEELSQISAHARVKRREGATVAGEIRPAVAAVVSNLVERAQACVQPLRGSLASVQGIPTILEDRLRETTRLFEQYVARLREIAFTYAPESLTQLEDPVQFSARLLSDVSILITEARRTGSDLQVIADTTQQEFAALGEQARVAVVGCRDSITTLVSELRNKVMPLLSALQSSDRIDIASLEFGDAVLLLDLRDVPASTEFALKRTGPRGEGDAILIRLAAGTKGEGGRVVEVEHRELRMFRVLPHIQMAVGLIWADPFPATATSSTFQMAASYSILFRFFNSRSSILYNRLLRTSVGLNVAALDFNNDDAIELGFGVVLNTLNGFAQVGGGVNVFGGELYWFFGLQLPAGLPGIN